MPYEMSSFSPPLNTLDPVNAFNMNEYTDFTSFIDSIPFPAHPFSPSYQPLPFHASLFPLTNQFDQPVEPTRPGDETPENVPDAMRSRLGSRLPSLEPEEQKTAYPSSRTKSLVSVSAECRERLVASLAEFSNVVADCSETVLPSRHALSRFISGYINVFHEHYPFFHIATMSIDRMIPELVLSIASLGARYCREPDMSMELFHLAKSMTMERIRRRHLAYATIMANGGTNGYGYVDRSASSAMGFNLLEIIQATVILTAVSMWFQNKPPLSEALFIRSTLDALVRESGWENTNVPVNDSWETWIQVESTKRTKLVVFCFFNIQTIAYDLPPVIMAEEINFDLPCSEREWQAETETAWRELRNQQHPRPSFRIVFSSLFELSTSPSKISAFTSFGGYFLIHALIQHIWMLQKSVRLPTGQPGTLAPADMGVLEHALERWCQSWKRNHESSVDPLSPHGSLSFTSTALLRLAYIRINMDVTSDRLLSTWDPILIARSLRQSAFVQRSDRVTKAALHCAHALSIPIKLGINFVARTQVVLWSNQHALCSLECAILLAKWLEAATMKTPHPPLTEQESRLLDFVLEMVAETEYKSPREHLLETNTRLSAIVTRLWAKLFGSEAIWEMLDLIGRSLNSYADLLEMSIE